MVIAVVLAAGSGKRMNSEVAKQYIKLFDKEILAYSLETIQQNKNIDSIIIVTREEDIEYCKRDIAEKYNISKVASVIKGGKERYDSVYQALCEIKNKYNGNNHIVMIHDGARPFITDEMIEESIDAANEFGACTVGVPAKDTIKIIDENGFSISTPDREKVYQIQTPQTFKFDILMSAHESFRKDSNRKITDDTMLVEQYNGVSCKVVCGAYENIKVTTPEDLEVAESFAKKNIKKIEKMC